MDGFGFGKGTFRKAADNVELEVNQWIIYYYFVFLLLKCFVVFVFLCSVQDLELENEHCQLQQEIRERMSNVGTNEKTSKSLQDEKQMLERCLDIISRRDKIVTKLEEERVK